MTEGNTSSVVAESCFCGYCFHFEHVWCNLYRTTYMEINSSLVACKCYLCRNAYNKHLQVCFFFIFFPARYIKLNFLFKFSRKDTSFHIVDGC